MSSTFFTTFENNLECIKEINFFTKTFFEKSIQWLYSNNFSIKKIERVNELKKTGFVNFDEVESNYDIQTKKIIHETKEYYEKNYPDYKLTELQPVISFCKEYGFVLAKSENYKGSINDRNKENILDFKVKTEDIVDINSSYDMDKIGMLDFLHRQGSYVGARFVNVITSFDLLNTKDHEVYNMELKKTSPSKKADENDFFCRQKNIFIPLQPVLIPSEIYRKYDLRCYSKLRFFLIIEKM